jgi:integrase
MKLPATVKEAIADAKIDISQKEAAQARAGAPRPRTRQDGCPEQSDVCQRTANLRARNSRVPRPVLSEPLAFTLRSVFRYRIQLEQRQYARRLAAGVQLRDYAMLAMQIGCGLRPAELLALTLESIQQRVKTIWVIADLSARRAHPNRPGPRLDQGRCEPVHTATDITHGHVFRAINKAGRIWGDSMTPKVIWEVVKSAAARAGIEKTVAARSPTQARPVVPSDRRRTGAESAAAGVRVDPDDAAVTGVLAIAAPCRQRPARHQTGIRGMIRAGRRLGGEGFPRCFGLAPWIR